MVVLVVGAAACWAMIGVIWLVQLVQYPMLVARSDLALMDAAAEHQRRIVPVVGPLMAAEGVTALVLLVHRPETMGAVSAWVAAALLGIALASTAFVQVPLHARLAAGSDPRAGRQLVASNWVRTAAWSGRGVVLAAVLAT